MMQLEQIRNFFPADIRENASFQKYMVKEYLQLLILDYLSTTPFIRKVVFIGGTNLRLTKGIDRFSEDLDFDCKALSKEEFIEMTDAIIRFLMLSGFRIEVRDRASEKANGLSKEHSFSRILVRSRTFRTS
ncbi:MAG: nucleotidyl transferase AbiEii/AbiGii toxin family protein [Bacteroidales bacterium]